MKTMQTNIKMLCAALLVLCAAPLTSQAQGYAMRNDNTGNFFVTADWQINSISNDFVSNTSGWGANTQLNYYINEKLSAGVFLAWHSNYEYIPTQTYVNGTRSTTTDMQRSIYQLPFGALVQFDLGDTDGVVSPYIGAKIGANFARFSHFYETVRIMDETWGFYLSPEVGLNIYPTYNHRFGFHIAAFYGYASNQSDSWDVSGISNFGVRIGGTFRF